jgi:hypothetical protein
MLRQRISFAFLLTCLLCSFIHAQSTKPLSISLIAGTTTTSPTHTTPASSQVTLTSAQSLVSQSSHSGSGSVGSGSVGSQQSNAPSSAYSSVSVNPVDPPGGVTMLTPAASDASSTYYKIGTTVTFSWSYTSVQVIPTAVNVEAYCAVNKYFQS